MIFVEGGKLENPEKSPRSQIEINQSQPTYEPRIEPGSQLWEAWMMISACADLTPLTSKFVFAGLLASCEHQEGCVAQVVVDTKEWWWWLCVSDLS